MGCGGVAMSCPRHEWGRREGGRSGWEDAIIEGVCDAGATLPRWHTPRARPCRLTGELAYVDFVSGKQENARSPG